MKRILLGGSFDPIHDGHYIMAEVAKEQIGADIVEFVLAPRSRWKEGAIDVNDRIAMLHAYLDAVPWARICLHEVEKNADINYTVETIKYFREKYPSDELFLLIGADQLDKFHDWYQADEIARLCQIICYRRPGYSIHEVNLRKYRVRLIEGVENNVSSSAIRGLFNLDTKDGVIDYICDHRLYFMHKIANFISEKRINHSVEVAKLARKIAITNHLDKKKAFLAGLLHDIAKEIPKDNSEYLMGAYYPEYHHLNQWLHHQFIGEYLARTAFSVASEEVLEAIKWHATGNANMGAIAKVVYSADKIEPTRGYDSTYMIEACLKDYDEGFILVLSENKKFLEGKHYDTLNELTKACYECYLK
jgi:nicotinate-nucleotide adenylyltransferase